uniref:Endonuclease III homolog n=1 Tax=Strigamia maritima TaxID=126957 RepID=T1JNU5_STRMM
MASRALRSRSLAFVSKTEMKIEEKPKIKRLRTEVKYEEEANTKGDWQPENWRETLANIEKMREKRDAPVDSMGCHKCSDETLEPEVYRWQILVSLMLSSQTKDQMTHAAMARLREFGLTVDHVANTENSILEKLIYPVGFYKRKAEYLKKTARILRDDYDGDIAPTVESLCKLPGVGPKMAHLCMQVAWGQVTGIGVDTHVHRIVNRLKWVRKPTKTPDATRIALQDWLPQELWRSINISLVGFGQQTCLPVNPKCQVCLNKNICPSSKYK